MGKDCNECLYCSLTEYEQYYIAQKYRKLLKHYCSLHQKELKHCNCGSKQLVPCHLCNGKDYEQKEKKRISVDSLGKILNRYEEGIFL